ncbi:MAG: phosphate acyltransferase PlsX [Rhodospirillales bacterium]|nr:phosphate acyltransferase PlsX [Rhodospirillales bacterium]MDG4603221.1 phosphate acyltransferase PlsX [Defluviicoccus sp.]MDG4609852.1 phosphate acyltransferase PlsX [Defluviicoccus sp.]
MANPVMLAVDAMGGDRAPAMVIEGLDLALAHRPNVRLLLFGRAVELAGLLKRYRRVSAVAEVRDTQDVIGGGERPSSALRSGQNSSMRRAIDSVASGEADGVVSAGNTGALMAMAKFVLRTLPGVGRPAIASAFPTLRGQSVILDLGANVDCGADNLVQFAVMGEVFARKVLGIEKPSVGLLNVGQEELKGNDAVKKAAAILQGSALSIRFHGFVEGDDIAAGTVDVVVTDGFTGNVALKTAEGTARLLTHFLKQALLSSPRARLAGWLAAPALRRMANRTDPRQHDGAMFLGLNGVCVKSHGGTDAVGFASACGVAIELIADGVNEEIKRDFAYLRGGTGHPPERATG